MRLSTRPSMEVVTRDQKQARLEAFFRTHVEQRQARAGFASPPRPWRVVARSADSPVISALAVVANDYVGETLYIMALMAGGQPTAGQTCLFASFGRNHTIEVRRTIDARLIDAHEMLVLSSRTCWIGDSMRRDPLQRDSYECYAADCETIGRLSSISFDRLWAASRPAVKGNPASVTLGETQRPDALVGQPPAEAIEEATRGPEAGNRH